MLTDMECRKAKASQSKVLKLLDQNGLYLYVRPTGLKQWVYRRKAKINGKPKDQSYVIGEYPQTSLVQARLTHAELRMQVKQGIDIQTANQPQASAENKNRMTLSELSEKWYEHKLARMAERTAYNIRSVLRNHIVPMLGDMFVEELKPSHVLAMLQEIEAAGKMTVAIQARQLLSQMLRYGILLQVVETDVASSLEGYIQRPPIQHARALKQDEMQQFLCKLAVYNGRFVTRELVLFQVLTFVRSAEAINARWEDIDFKEKLWRIPAEFMKMRKPHVVPLSDQAILILETVKKLTGKWDYVFPGTDKRKPTGSTTINKAIANALFGYKSSKRGVITSHDFRATASTWLNEAGFPHNIIEMQLAHQSQNKVAAVYNQSEHLAKRREIMAWYSKKLEQLCPQVFVPRY